MKNKLSFLILMLFISLMSASCEVDAGAEDLGLGDAGADDLILQSRTFLSLKTGDKIGARISGDNHQYVKFLTQEQLESWNPQNGDIFFFRGNIVANYHYDVDFYGVFFAIVPLEPEFYWNGVGLYYDGFLYKITATENGPRIYNQGLWTIGDHCLIVHASSSLSLQRNEINADMMAKIHTVKVRRGHLKKEKMNPNISDSFTPPGLVDRFYTIQGKKIRPDTSGEYVKAEDFIEKTDAVSGYFQSRTSDLVIKKVFIYDEDSRIDCARVY
jgi:hypothetical protein